MSLPIIFDNVALTSKQWGLVHPLAGDSFQATEQFTSATANGTIDGSGFGTVTLSFPSGSSVELVATVFDTGDVIILQSTDPTTGDIFYISHAEHDSGDIFTFTEHDLGDFVPCYDLGTKLATPDGERPVEDLRPGDAILTFDGRQCVVRWVGCRHVDLTRHRDPEDLAPIVIHANALADGIPRWDLVVSPDHAMFIAGVLVPARMLVNGSSIARDMTRDSVVYYHIELETHDILLAEGAPAESYLDTGNRSRFDNANGAVRLCPLADVGQADRVSRSCAPFRDDRATIEPIWRSLADRALRLGCTGPSAARKTDDPNLTLVASGRRFAPVSRGKGVYTFVVPPLAGGVRLASRATRPCMIEPLAADRRRLGVAVRRITLLQEDYVQTIPADHQMLANGWWKTERDGTSVWRWTNGSA